MPRARARLTLKDEGHHFLHGAHLVLRQALVLARVSHLQGDQDPGWGSGRQNPCATPHRDPKATYQQSHREPARSHPEKEPWLEAPRGAACRWGYTTVCLFQTGWAEPFGSKSLTQASREKSEALWVKFPGKPRMGRHIPALQDSPGHGLHRPAPCTF